MQREMNLQDIDFDGRKLRFSLEPYFGDYDEVKKQIESDSLIPATFREIVALLFASQKSYEKDFKENEVMQSFKSGHLLFGYTALEQRPIKEKYNLVEQDNPQISEGNLILRGNEKITKGEVSKLRNDYYSSLGKSIYHNLISDRSWLYNRESLAVIPAVRYKQDRKQLSCEERYSYSDDWGRDRVNITPARYSEDNYNIFSELEIEKGRLHLNKMPIRAVSFGIKIEGNKDGKNN